MRKTDLTTWRALGRRSQILAAVLVFCGMLTLSQSFVLGHPPANGEQEHEHADDDAASNTIGTALLLPDIEGPKPWSDKPALTDENRFSIAIMTDRTGGHRPGIWMKAVERINWLRPDFVVSVGDLIEGYTEDDEEIARQWQEFLGFIDKMEMKFFFVPGNHDVTNPKLHQIWRKQFGKEWYSFDYKGVHFVCMNSEDPSAHIGDEQLAWLNEDLKANAEARWTLVFLHKPIWTYTERDLQAGNADSSNWSKVSEMLGERPHTVFAGHVHHYVQYQRNGRDYYSLATTGGGSALRGLPYGEFDHITWLSMEQDGPRVANLMLDGIQPADIVTESSIEKFREFLQVVRVEVEPIFISGDEIQTGDIRIKLRNDFSHPVKIKGKIEGLPLVGLTLESQSIELDCDAGQSIAQTLNFQMKEPVSLQRFQSTTMTVQVESDETPPLRAEYIVPVVIDKEYDLVQQKIAIDGDLKEWSTSWWSTESRPTLVGAVQNWKGAGDNSFQVTASYGDDRLHFAVRVTDERVVEGDKVTLLIDARPQLERLNSSPLGRGAIVLTVDAPTSDEISSCNVYSWRQRAATGAKAFGRKTKDGYEFELSTPIDQVVEAQGSDWSSIQLGVRVSDLDAVGEEAVEVLWRSAQNVRDNRPMAHLIRK